ncbi:hypothetical protein [Kibdelosporangium aridum]|uniref:hypothetical protein n=1 Tax=Kibdelosporangium aridum TaxID=2030 RepID=UPI0035E9754F
MWICLVLVLGLVAFLAARRNARTYPEVEIDHVQPMASTCVVIRSHYVPSGPRRPSGRRQRAHYAAPGR